MKDLENLPTLRVRGTIAPREVADSFGESFSSSDCLEFLESVKDQPEILVEISSNGGSVTEAKEIFTRLKNSGKKITTLTYVARSAATLIMLSGQKRLLAENADVRIHPARVYPEDLGLEALLAEDLIKIGLEVEKATEDILNIYCRVLGEDKRTGLMASMTEDMDLSPKEVIRLGFANGYYKKDKKEVENSYGFLITDHLESIIKNNMPDKKEDASKLEGLIQNGFRMLARKLGMIKNEVTVNTDKGAVYIEPANPEAPGDYMGAKVYKVDEAGLQTTEPVDDGDYKLDDGTVLTVAGGSVTLVTPAVDANKLKEELAAKETALQEKVTELAAAKAELDTLKSSFETTKTEMTGELTKIQNAFREYQNQVTGDHSDKKDDDNQKLDLSKMSTAQRVRAMSKERAKLDIK